MLRIVLSNLSWPLDTNNIHAAIIIASRFSCTHLYRWTHPDLRAVALVLYLSLQFFLAATCSRSCFCSLASPRGSWPPNSLGITLASMNACVCACECVWLVDLWMRDERVCVSVCFQPTPIQVNPTQVKPHRHTSRAAASLAKTQLSRAPAGSTVLRMDQIFSKMAGGCATT